MMKKYTFIFEKYKKGWQITTTNKGYTALEVAGILSTKLYDIHRQIAGEVKPKIKFDRTVIVKKKKRKRGNSGNNKH